jgi:hypothetical protein
MKRQRVFSIALIGIAVFLLFWWPLSHWFYYRWYNDLLGFVFASTNDGLVKMIGTCGLMPTLALAALALRPKDNGPLVAALSVFSFLLALTFAFLVARGDFPKGELINVALTGGLSVLLPVAYRWAQKQAIT